jgi:histidinol-phosphate aminotransferase
VIVGPTYSFYRLRLELAGANWTEISMNDDFSLPVARIIEATGGQGVVFVCSPNNPTGNQFRTDDLTRLCENFPGLIVVDEAYVDFANESIIEQVSSLHNLLVLRTFSKIYGLADLRLGFVIANSDWATIFRNRVQYPYPISGLATSIALRLLREYDLVSEGVESLKRERSWLFQELKSFQNVEVIPSVANFLLLGLKSDYSKVHDQLLKRGIATKSVGRILRLENCIRVTIGTRDMNRTFLDALSEVLRNA